MNNKISAKIGNHLILAEAFVGEREKRGIIRTQMQYLREVSDMPYINRHIENQITQLSKSWSAILLTGSRRSGKTTMLRRLAKKENIGRIVFV